MNERERRIGENEALFRQVNERLQEVNEAFGWLSGTFQIVCECGNSSCIERIALTPSEYEALRGDPTTFAVLRGHDAPYVESVVADRDDYVVVRKTPGAPAELAADLHPRS